MTSLQKTIESLKNISWFKNDGFVDLKEKKDYLLTLKTTRGEKVNIDVPAENEKEAEIFLKGFMSAEWYEKQIH